MPEFFPRLIRPTLPITDGDTSIRVTSVNPFSSRLPGGGTATLLGWGFRKNSNGTAPSVLVCGVAATGVVVVDQTTLTFTIPAGASTGVGDIVVTIDGNVATLHSGFTYIAEQILSISPSYGPLIGGTQITLKGVNFDPNIKYRVRFGSSDFGTGVVVIDQNTILVTTPNHAIGFVDVSLMNCVVMFSPSIFSVTIFDTSTHADQTYTTFRLGFQYTLLVRGEDIRRNPGISINESLGAAPSTCNFRIDGRSNAPKGGEKIQITDSFDSGRLLWAGTVQTVKQIYEGLTNQLAWDATCVDFTWLANRIRPKGAWFQVSASQIVKELVAQCCPGFTSNFVQSNLAKVTIVCDGSDDLTSTLNKIAEAIGGGHWYFDFTQDLHFFHRPSDLIPPNPPIDTSLVTGFATLTAGAVTPALINYTRGFYAVRVQFVYSDGTLSGLSPWSNLVYFDGSKLFSLSNIPTGPARGSLTTTARRLWVHRFSAITDPALRDSIWRVLPFCQINDNTTTAFTTFFGSTGASVAGIVDIGATVAVPDGGNPNHPSAPAGAPSALTSSYVNGDPGWWTGSWFNYRYAYLYRDGSVSMASAPSTNIGYQYMTRGYLLSTARVGVTPGPVIGTNNDCIARLVWQSEGIPKISGYSESWSGTGPGVGYGQGVAGYLLADPVWSTGAGMVEGIAVIPDNVTDHIHFNKGNLGDPIYASNGGSGSGFSAYWTRVPGAGDDIGDVTIGGVNCCFGSAHSGLFMTDTDKSYTFTPDPVPAWPNEDGPYLEDVNKPTDITASNTQLLYETAGTPFSMTTDRSQVRNRVFVIGAGSTLTQAYVDGDLKVYVADITSFALGGGRLRIEDVATGTTEFQDYSGLAQKDGVPYIVLKRTLNFKYSQNAVVYNFYQADDKNSQDYMAKTELDYTGRPTDGVHEFTISDSSLKTVWQLYMRAYAELELYAWPIVSVEYSTRDANSRIGKTVHVDMTNPPCQGDFLIQNVTIDQVHDEGDAIFPRYTVKASTLRFDLDDLLIKMLGQGGGSGISVGGIANAGTNQSGQSPVATTNIFTNSPVKFGYTFPAFNTVTNNSQWVYSPVGEPTSISASSLQGGQANGKTLADGRQFGLAGVGAGPGASNPMGQTSLILGMPGLGAKARWLLRVPTKAEMDLSLNPNALFCNFGIGTSILGIGVPSAQGVYVSFNGNAGGGQLRDHWYMNVIGTDANYFFDLGKAIQDSDYDFTFEELDALHFKMTVIGLGATPAPIPSGVFASPNSTGTGVAYVVPFRPAAGASYWVASNIQTNLVTTNGIMWIRRVEWSCN
jgi:hypothetical protein